LTHEHEGPDSDEPVSETPGSVPDRGGVVDRPARDSDLPRDGGPNAGPDADALARDLSSDGPGPGRDTLDKLVSLVLARIEHHQNIHLPEQAPNAAQLEELKRRAPEAYDLWIDTTRKRVDHDIWRSRKAVRQPYLLGTVGQVFALVAVLAVLCLAGLAFYLDHPWAGAFLGIVDIIGLAAVFNNNQGRRQNPPPQKQQPQQPQQRRNRPQQ
jgi:hypothetical protein